ncbi:MAG: type II toxin-antitoxin system HicB family antitoxin, partial [Cyanobacteria bacterium J06555_3]
MNYKGYEAVVEFDDEDRLFVGRVINTRDVIAFDGLSVDELEQSFHAVIDEYLEDCESLGKTPDKPFS